VPSSATTTDSPVGFWDSYAYITNWGPGPVKHATPAGPFPNPTTITSYDPATGAFSGIDNAWDVGKEAMNGVLRGNSVTYTLTGTGVVLHGQGTVTFYSDGTATWIGTWSNSIGQSGTSYATLRGFLLAGTVQALSCGEDSCNPPTGLAGQPVLVQGTSSDGSAVSVSATSDADGTWSVGVPNGSYDVGPTSDGKTVGIPSFDPAKLPETVTGKDISDLNFMACPESEDGTRLADANGAQNGRVAFYRPGSGLTESLCKSGYTVTVSARIPQAQIVDPSTIAPYNSSTDPNKPTFPAETGAVATLFYQRVLDSVFETYPRYPSCNMTFSLADLAKDRTQLRWYTYLSGGPLGQVTVPLVWNQKAQMVYFNGAPSETNGSLTRTWVYQYVGTDKTLKCSVTAPVSPVYYVVPGGSDRRGLVNDNAFTIVVLWYIPFAAVGATVAPNTTAELALKKAFGEEVGADLVETWEHLPWLARFAAVTSLGGLGGKALHAAELAATELPSTIKAAEDIVQALEIGSNVYEKLEHSHVLYDALMGGWSGIYSVLNKGYPVMGAVIRGNFHSEWQPNETGTTKYLKSTTLGVSVKSTAFPDITLRIAREAKPSRSGTDVGRCKDVYEGVLPWANTPPETEAWSCPVTNNAFAANPPYLIAQTTKQYPRGKQAVKEILAATDQLNALGTDVRTTASLSADLMAEQALVNAPSCDPSSGQASTPSTFCWVFADGRP
jgi:hypothetical protein